MSARLILSSIFIILVLQVPVHGSHGRPVGRGSTSPGSVAPLIATTWDEKCFYNNSCPVDPDATLTCLHAPAGSGAIAMAQIMKFYRYPAKGTGEHGYVHPKYGIQYTNFAATSYNWDSYPLSISTINEPLAGLIYQCSVAQDMDFGTAGSSSTAANLDSGLIKYFSYPKSAVWKNKADYSGDEWSSMLKGELDAGHPLICSGQNYNGMISRFFICDGYQTDGTFHINWGMGGAFNGYFQLNSLLADTVNYSYNQRALFGLSPQVQPASIVMDFENVADFSLTFNDWSVYDVDKHDTYGITNYNFPHQMEPMAFLCFNPAAVSPSMSGDQAIQPHGGQRFGACFSSNPPSNDDWFISPQVQLGTGGNFSFWIKSYNNTYGVDEYQVCISTTDNNPSSFIPISGTAPLQTTTTWSKKFFNLSDYNNQKVYLAIHCVSYDHFLMMIDDLEIKPQASTLLTADFVANKTIVRVGDTISFQDQSTGAPVSWKWSFPGAVPASSTLQNPSVVVYPKAGVYPVSLLISNGSASDSLKKEDYITVRGYPSSMSLDFESLADFTLDFSPWTTIDVNGGNTYGITNVIYPHYLDPMAWICFNPSHTSPVLTNMQPHSGMKLGCSFSSMPPNNPNNKWLISPKMSLGNSPLIEFWVQTYNTLYGYEKFNVAVSTTDQSPASFTPLTAQPDSAPATWTKKSFSLSAYSNRDVYVGIQCVTNDGFILMLDDISITSAVGISETLTRDRVSLFPNPATDLVSVKVAGAADQPIRVELLTTAGITVRSWNTHLTGGITTLDLAGINQGLYILRFDTGTSLFTSKLSVID